MNKIVTCPKCEKESDLSISNPFRPFCSERCRLVDLGQWIEGAYTIPESTAPDSNTDNIFHIKTDY
ncbi:MAG: DNA gyrase inhibitor YacG [Proteobacteria bacterium]|nr:DNA gyrase inhibitor YacG [Pseudomonadota bacterium]